jgi:transposase
MDNTAFFASLLDLTSDWKVSSVELVESESSVRLEIEHVGSAKCPECDKACPVYDHSEARSWRHLDTMQFLTVLTCRVPRANCREHGIRQMSVPWAGAKSRFTQMFELAAIHMLQLTKCQARTARLLRLSGDQVHDIMHRAVERGMVRRRLDVVAHVGIDEKSFQRRDFATILCDIGNKRVLAVERGRAEDSAKLALKTLPQRGLVKTVCIDMSDAYKSAASYGLGGAEIIHDRFHVAALLSRAVDETRRAEVKSRPELKKTRFIWLKNPASLTERQRTTFDELAEVELKTANAYALKQMFRSFFEQNSVPDALEFLVHWLEQVKDSELPKMKLVALTLIEHFAGLVNAVKWKLTNAYAESLNASIQEIKTVARGFRRFESFRVAILFFLGKLDLSPLNYR